MKDKFSDMSKQEIKTYIIDKKSKLGEELNIMGYPGQFGDLLQFADFTGCSEEILEYTNKSKAQYILFTGWRFFTEIPDIFNTNKTIIQANIKNDCPIADAMDDELIKYAYQKIVEKSTKAVIPLSFIATSSKIRDFTGNNNGSTCTPWNAKKIIDYYLKQNNSIFFIPANDAFNIITALNLPEDEVFTVDKHTDFNNIPGDKKLYAWNVECYIHKNYNISDIKHIRKKHKNINVMVHKECSQEIIDKSDKSGFVGDIYKTLKDAPENSSWAVATAHTWVERAAKEFSNKKIVSIREDLTCEGLEITEPSDIARSLESIINHKNGTGDILTRCIVPNKFKPGAQKALKKMFKICK